MDNPFDKVLGLDDGYGLENIKIYSQKRRKTPFGLRKKLEDLSQEDYEKMVTSTPWNEPQFLAGKGQKQWTKMQADEASKSRQRFVDAIGSNVFVKGRGGNISVDNDLQDHWNLFEAIRQQRVDMRDIGQSANRPGYTYNHMNARDPARGMDPDLADVINRAWEEAAIMDPTVRKAKRKWPINTLDTNITAAGILPTLTESSLSVGKMDEGIFKSKVGVRTSDYQNKIFGGYPDDRFTQSRVQTMQVSKMNTGANRHIFTGRVGLGIQDGVGVDDLEENRDLSGTEREYRRRMSYFGFRPGEIRFRSRVATTRAESLNAPTMINRVRQSRFRVPSEVASIVTDLPERDLLNTITPRSPVEEPIFQTTPPRERSRSRSQPPRNKSQSSIRRSPSRPPRTATDQSSERDNIQPIRDAARKGLGYLPADVVPMDEEEVDAMIEEDMLEHANDDIAQVGEGQSAASLPVSNDLERAVETNATASSSKSPRKPEGEQTKGSANARSQETIPSPEPLEPVISSVDPSVLGALERVDSQATLFWNMLHEDIVDPLTSHQQADVTELKASELTGHTSKEPEVIARTGESTESKEPTTEESREANAERVRLEQKEQDEREARELARRKEPTPPSSSGSSSSSSSSTGRPSSTPPLPPTTPSPSTGDPSFMPPPPPGSKMKDLRKMTTQEVYEHLHHLVGPSTFAAVRDKLDLVAGYHRKAILEHVVFEDRMQDLVYDIHNIDKLKEKTKMRAAESISKSVKAVEKVRRELATTNRNITEDATLKLRLAKGERELTEALSDYMTSSMFLTKFEARRRRKEREAFEQRERLEAEERANASKKPKSKKQKTKRQ